MGIAESGIRIVCTEAIVLEALYGNRGSRCIQF